MAEFLPPSMPEPPRADGASVPEPVPVPEQVPVPEPAPTPPPVPSAPSKRRSASGGLGKLISLIVSVGLAWALTVAITAWLLSLFLSRG